MQRVQKEDSMKRTVDNDTTESPQLKELRMRRMGIDKQIRQV